MNGYNLQDDSLQDEDIGATKEGKRKLTSRSFQGPTSWQRVP